MPNGCVFCGNPHFNGVELCCSECDCRRDYDDEPQFCMGCGAKVVEVEDE